MKRKVWNQISVPQQKTTGLYLRLDAKSGSIVFSFDLVKALQLDKNRVNFIQDEDRPCDWYIELTESTDAFIIRSKDKSKSDKSSIVQSTVLCRAILTSIGVEGSARVLVATDPIEKNLYAILTTSAIQLSKRIQKAA